MFIVFGTTPVTKTLDEGTFNCPNCDYRNQDYELKETREYFSLYMLPIFPISESIYYKECQTCLAAFDPYY